MPYPSPDPITLPDPWAVGELRLRLPTDTDVPAILSACQDEAIQRYTRVPSPYTREDAAWFVDHAAEQLAAGRGVHTVVTDATDDQLLGTIGLELDHRDFTGELGYWVATDARGRGVVASVGPTVCRFAFEQLGMQALHLWTAATNPASQRVAARLGFRHAGTLPRAGADGPTADPTAPRVDMHLWGLLPGELV